ncbi:hypothetical protein EOM39_03350 [Candidatus Gracilibacteria bacterium]|nr:hypothetical protein [Candidatus Gracilibacteria bacterium]
MAKSTVQQEYSTIKDLMDTYLKDAKNFRNVWEIRSFVNESFYEGNHRVMFDTVSRQLVNLPIKSDNEYYIGKIRKIVRGVRNMILKNDPRWHPRSSRIMKVSDDEIQVASAILQDIYKEEHLKDKFKDLLTHSLTKTLAWAYIGFDSVKNDIDIYIEDPFNVYTSPDGRLEGPVFVGKYMIRTIRKSLDDIKNSEIYKNGPFKEHLDKICAESRQAESDQKNQILEANYQIPLDKNGSVILKEMYVMETVENKDNKEEVGNTSAPEEDAIKHSDSKKKIRIVTKVGDYIIRDEMTDYDHFPLIAYLPERNKGLLYFASWIEPLISLNKALNDGYSNRADWLDKFAKGRYLVQKGSKFSIIKGRNGQVVEYTGGRPVVQETGNLPNEVNIHLNESERYMEDIGGIHSESTGRLSGGAISGVAIAQLQASDSNNVSEPVDNLKTFLEELAYRVLDLASKKYNLKKITLESGKEVSVVGSEISDMTKEATGKEIGDNVIRIKAIRSMEVEIVPGSAFSDLQMRQDLVELRGLGVAIPDALIIEAYKLGNTQQILNDYQAEEEAKMKFEGSEEGMESTQAELENKKMLEGAVITAQEIENHQIHLAIHAQLLSQLGSNAQKYPNIVQHVQQHDALIPQNNKPKQVQMEQENNPTK